jgi:hypothetical protein
MNETLELRVDWIVNQIRAKSQHRLVHKTE